MFISRNVLGATLVSFGLLAAAGAQAALLSVNTGVDNLGATLASGSTDSHWTISVNGGTTFNSAKVAFPSQTCCGMEAVANTAAWITDQGTAGSASTGWGVNNTVYLRNTFDLSNFDLGTTQLSLTWRLADHLVGIYLNGVMVQSSITGTWATDRTLQVSSGFAAGLNTLEFRGYSQNSVWDGLWVAGSIRGDDLNVVPLPGSLALGALALACLVAARRRVSKTV